MEPLYEFKDEQAGFKYLLIVLGLAMFAMAVFIPDDPKVGGAFMWGLRLMFVFFGAVTLIFVPVVRLRAFHDHVEVRYGVTRLVSFRLDNEKIVNIRSVEYNPLRDFGGWGVKGGAGEWKGYTAFTASITRRALAIETTEKNYLIGCPNPDEAETMLKNAIGLR